MSRYFGSPVSVSGMSALYNGRSNSALYKIGLVTSNNAGLTWTRYASNPVITPGTGWESSYIIDPSLIWDGSQWVVYYAGSDGTTYRIGRATSPDLVTWTKYGSNPVLDVGVPGNFDDYSVNFPTVLYDPGAVHTWQMWYTGWPDGTGLNTTIGYCYSSDGLSWTRVARMLDVGSGGDFDDSGLATGPVVRSGSNYTIFYAGYDGAEYHTGYATSTDPTSAGSYTKHGVFSDFSGDITVSGVIYKSNQLRSLVATGSTYFGMGSLFHPTDSSFHEVSFSVPMPTLTTFGTISGPVMTLTPGTWDEKSAENPSVVAT
ncbi:MAG: hypothetical protein PHS14_13115 [Elusimicrobia bacterium]|nr:hypothetical protein [Elusimicrobiota bacterium]